MITCLITDFCHFRYLPPPYFNHNAAVWLQDEEVSKTWVWETSEAAENGKGFRRSNQRKVSVEQWKMRGKLHQGISKKRLSENTTIYCHTLLMLQKVKLIAKSVPAREHEETGFDLTGQADPAKEALELEIASSCLSSPNHLLQPQGWRGQTGCHSGCFDCNEASLSLV